MSTKATTNETIKRLPISLKFDASSKFYTEFIEGLRENRNLTSFIVDILEVYYTQPEVKKLVDRVLYPDVTSMLQNQQVDLIGKYAQDGGVLNDLEQKREYFLNDTQTNREPTVTSEETVRIAEMEKQMALMAQQMNQFMSAMNPSMGYQAVNQQGYQQMPVGNGYGVQQAPQMTQPMMQQQVQAMQQPVQPVPQSVQQPMQQPIQQTVQQPIQQPVQQVQPVQQPIPDIPVVPVSMEEQEEYENKRQQEALASNHVMEEIGDDDEIISEDVEVSDFGGYTPPMGDVVTPPPFMGLEIDDSDDEEEEEEPKSKGMSAFNKAFSSLKK